MNLQPGLKGSAETVVVYENTAAAVGSGALAVFATPSMIGLMEKTALETVMPFLAEGESTVGTEIHVTHDAAVPLGFRVTAEAELLEVDRRKLIFRVLARSGDEIIGQGTHTRFIVSVDRFMQKVEAKKNNL